MIRGGGLAIVGGWSPKTETMCNNKLLQYKAGFR